MALREEDKSYDKEPPHMKNKAGRVFITTPALLIKSDMTPVYDYVQDIKKTDTKAKIPELKEFDLSKATKQQIVTKAMEEFDKELPIDLSAKKLREKFKELINAGSSDS